MILSEEISAYQTYLEGHRLDPDNELLYEDMLKAKAHMEIAWLECLGPQNKELPSSLA
jgi:hypothetical protein